MDVQAKKTVLRMIPYGLFVLTARSKSGQIGTATVNWVMQASFEPPLVAIGVKVDSNIHAVIQGSRAFALNVLGKGQEEIATKFFREAQVTEGMLSGEPYQAGENGSPLLERAIGYLECELIDALSGGDHSVMLGQVSAAGVRQAPQGRPDEAVLRLPELDGDIFYGG